MFSYKLTNTFSSTEFFGTKEYNFRIMETHMLVHFHTRIPLTLLAEPVENRQIREQIFSSWSFDSEAISQTQCSWSMIADFSKDDIFIVIFTISVKCSLWTNLLSHWSSLHKFSRWRSSDFCLKRKAVDGSPNTLRLFTSWRQQIGWFDYRFVMKIKHNFDMQKPLSNLFPDQRKQALSHILL